MGKEIGAAEFKAHCSRIMKEADLSGETVTITKRGKPFMELRPVQAKRPKLYFGCMAHPDQRLDDDPEQPAYDGPWDAELDRDEDDPGAGTR